MPDEQREPLSVFRCCQKCGSAELVREDTTRCPGCGAIYPAEAAAPAQPVPPECTCRHTDSLASSGRPFPHDPWCPTQAAAPAPVLTPEFQPQTISGMGYTDEQVSKLKELIENKLQAPVLTPDSPDTEHGMSSVELGQHFGKFFQPAPPEAVLTQPGAEPEKLTEEEWIKKAYADPRTMLFGKSVAEIQKLICESERPVLPVGTAKDYWPIWTKGILPITVARRSTEEVACEFAEAYLRTCPVLPVRPQIDATFVAAVEDEIGHGSVAWDMIHPEKICSAVLKVARASSPAVAPMHEIVLDPHNTTHQVVEVAAPAVAGRTQGDARIKELTAWAKEGPSYRIPMAINQAFEEGAALRESAREANSDVLKCADELIGLWGDPESTDIAPRAIEKLRAKINEYESLKLREASPEAPSRHDEQDAAFRKLALILGNPTLEADENSSLEMELVKLVETRLAPEAPPAKEKA